jgi:hypothetical protein
VRAHSEGETSSRAGVHPAHGIAKSRGNRPRVCAAAAPSVHGDAHERTDGVGLGLRDFRKVTHRS